MKIFFLILVLLFISGCSEKQSDSNTDGLNSEPLDGANSLTGSWYKDININSNLEPTKIPVAIKDYGDTVYVKFCQSFEWVELSKSGNDYYSNDIKILGYNENNELVNYNIAANLTYPMTKISNEVVTSFGTFKLHAGDVAEVDTEENVCANYGPPDLDISTRNSLTIDTPYAHGSVSLSINLEDLETGRFELGKGIGKSNISLSVYPVSNYKYYNTQSGEIEIVRRTDTSIAGNFTAVLKWGLSSSNPIPESIDVSGEFDVTFY